MKEEMAELDRQFGEQECANLHCEIYDIVEAGFDSFEEMRKRAASRIRPNRN